MWTGERAQFHSHNDKPLSNFNDWYFSLAITFGEDNDVRFLIVPAIVERKNAISAFISIIAATNLSFSQSFF